MLSALNCAAIDRSVNGFLMRPSRSGLKWVKLVFQTLVWATFFVAMAGMSWAALVENLSIPTYVPQQDKLSHLAGFFVLGALLAMGLGHRFYWWALSFCFALSIGVELAQHFLTITREFSLEDAAASALGGFIGLSLFCLPLWIAALIAEKRSRPASRARSHSLTIEALLPVQAGRFRRRLMSPPR